MPCTFWVVKVIFALCIVHSGYSSPDAASVIDVMRIQWENKCLLSARTNPIRTASDIISKQTRLHRGCVAYYLHNHKSGGTTMCHTALKSGYHITSLEDNCNLPMEIVSMDREHRTQGIAQDFVLNHPKLSFVAQEQPPFYPNISNDKYIYITTFRNPIDRVISHLHHGICTVRSLENAQKFLHNGNCSIDNIEDMTLSDLILDPCFDKELLWLSSNYYVSMFTGCIINRKKMSTDGYTNVCSRKHLSIAQNMLHYFSVIMITDTFEEFGRYSKLLDLKLSMKFTEKYREGTRENSKEKSMALRSNTSAWEKLVRLNSLDMEFFDYAKKLAKSYLIKELESQLLGHVDERRLMFSAQSTTQENFGTQSRRRMSYSREKPFCKFSSSKANNDMLKR